MVIYFATKKKEYRQNDKKTDLQQQINDVTSKITITTSYTGGPQDIGEADLNRLKCTCNEFKGYRQGFSIIDPRRLCQHLVKILKEKGLPENLAEFKPEIFYWADKNGGGFYNGVRIYKYLKPCYVNGKKVILEADSYDETSAQYWVNVIYADKRYGYCIDENRWSYVGVPPDREQIEQLIKDKLTEFTPKEFAIGSIQTTYRNHGKTRYSFKGEAENKTIWAYIKPENHIVDIKVEVAPSCLEEQGKYNLKTKEMNVHPHLKYMEKALLKWIEDEVGNLTELIT